MFRLSRLAFAVLVTLIAMLPLTASAATTVPASGLIFATGVTLTPISSDGTTATLHLHATALETGTLNGTSVADNTCVEQISTGQASCWGPEVLTGIIAGRGGQATFWDAYSLNFATGATSGTAAITSSTMGVRGAVQFAGNAFAPSGLPYNGQVTLS